MNKNEILKKICYTELVYERINKKLGFNLSKKQIEQYISEILKKTPESLFVPIGKNIYVSNFKSSVRITINSNTFRIITVDRIEKK